MLNKTLIVGLMLIIPGLTNTSYAQQSDSLSTLFTTSQERRLIDANRYKLGQEAKATMQTQTSTQAETTRDVIEDVSVDMVVSGFTITENGQNVAWINGKPYQNGSTLEDGSKLIVSDKANGLVQIKTPDGKYHSITAGKPVIISYQKPLDKG